MNSSQLQCSGTLISILVLLCLQTISAPAQTLQAPLSATRDYGMMGVIGDPQISSGLFNNPAGMSRSFVYAAEGQYLRIAKRQLNVLGFNVVDSKTQPDFVVGLGYGYGFTDDSADFDITSHDARLAVSKTLVENRLFAGVGFRYVREIVGSDDAAEVMDGFTVDTGLLFSITESFSVGAVGQNLMVVNGLPRRAGGGVALRAQSFVLDGDVLVDFDTKPNEKSLIYRIGTEFLAGDSVPIRGGFEANQANDSKHVSAGFGFIQTQGSRGNQLNLSYKQRIDKTDEIESVLALGVTMFL